MKTTKSVTVTYSYRDATTFHVKYNTSVEKHVENRTWGQLVSHLTNDPNIIGVALNGSPVFNRLQGGWLMQPELITWELAVSLT